MTQYASYLLLLWCRNDENRSVWTLNYLLTIACLTYTVEDEYKDKVILVHFEKVVGVCTSRCRDWFLSFRCGQGLACLLGSWDKLLFAYSLVAHDLRPAVTSVFICSSRFLKFSLHISSIFSLDCTQLSWIRNDFRHNCWLDWDCCFWILIHSFAP